MLTDPLHRLLLIAAAAIIAGLVAAVVTGASSDRFSSSARLAVQANPTADETVDGLAQEGQTTGTGAEATGLVARIARLDIVMENAEQRSGGDPSASEIRDSVDSVAEPDSRTVRITATSQSAGRSAEIATGYAQAVAAYVTDARSARFRELETSLRRRLATLPPADEQGDRGQALRSLIDRTALAATVRPVAVLDTGRPPSGPDTKPVLRNGLIAGGLAALLAGLVILLARPLARARRRRYISDAATLEEVFEAPVFVVAGPETIRRRPTSSLGAHQAWRKLLIQVETLPTNDSHRFLLLSPGRRDGRSSMAVELALAGASEKSVLVIEANLLHPSLEEALELGEHPGLTEALEPRVGRDPETTTDENVPGLDYLAQTWSAPGSSASFDVVTAGGGSHRVEALSANGQLQSLLDAAEPTYDLIIVEAPPGVDGVRIADLDGTVLVLARANRTSRRSALKLRAALDAEGVRPDGCVLIQDSGQLVRDDGPASASTSVRATTDTS